MAEPIITEADLVAADAYVPSPEVLDNEAYLVSRGVRPMALAGHCPAEPVIMLRVRTLLSHTRFASHVIPFIFPEGDESAAFGYAQHRWSVDLLEWALSDEVPAVRKHEILGLLCGYSAAAIARHQEADGMWEFRLDRQEGSR